MAATEYTWNPDVEATRAAEEERRLSGDLDRSLLRGYKDLFDQDARLRLLDAQTKKQTNFARLLPALSPISPQLSPGVVRGADVAWAQGASGALQAAFEADAINAQLAHELEKKRAVNQFLKERQHARNLNEMAKIQLINQGIGAGLTAGTLVGKGIQRYRRREDGSVAAAPEDTV